MNDHRTILELDDRQADLHREIYQEKIAIIKKRISAKEQEIFEHNAEIEQFQKLLKSLNGKNISPVQQDVVIKESKLNSTHENGLEFHSSLSLAKKAEFVLWKSQRLLTTREILESILEIEPDLLTSKETSFDRLQKNLAATLVQKVNKKNTFYRTHLGGEFKYGLLNKKNKELI